MSESVYRVKKILNNNVVLATQGFREVVVVGLGIGHHLRPRDRIESKSIEKVFDLRQEDLLKTTQLVQEIPDDTFFMIYRMIREVADHRNLQPDAHAYVTLVDHLHFAMERFRSGQKIRNLMLTDLKILYPEAYAFSSELLTLFNRHFAIDLPEDEVGFLTMHVVNGLYTDLDNQSSILTDCVFDCLNIIRDQYLLALKLDDLQTQRIMIHLKMLIQRVISRKQVDDSEKVLYNVFDEFESAYSCALQIQKYLEHRLRTHVNRQELVYLTIHIHRLEKQVGTH